MNQTPQQSIDALCALLAEETAIYQEMAGLLKQEREAMLGMKLDELGQITGRKETLALRVKALDESRKILARRLALAMGLAADQVTVTRLAEALPGLDSARLSRAAERLRSTVLECQELNAFNGRAAQRGMELVAGAVEYLINAADPAGRLYQAPQRGKVGAGRTSGYAAGGRGSTPPGFISRQA